jgi:hypothetical protein
VMVKYPDYLQEIACPYLLIDCDLKTHQNTLQLFTAILILKNQLLLGGTSSSSPSSMKVSR